MQNSVVCLKGKKFIS